MIERLNRVAAPLWRSCVRNARPSVPAALRLLTIATLLFAAVAKLAAYSYGPAPRPQWRYTHWVNLFAIEIELSLCIWLVIGVYRRAAFCAAFVLFLVFACISAAKAITDEGSCGCFGAIEINPWVTAAFDVALAIGLRAWLPSRPTDHVPQPRLYPTAVTIAALGWLAASGYTIGILALYLPIPWGTSTTGGARSTVVLKPLPWQGGRLPIIADVRGVGGLAQGQWTVLLYPHGCGKCERAAQALIDRKSRGLLNRHLALIDIQEADDSSAHNFECPDCHFGTLAGDKDWFAETPIILELSDGVVTNVITSPTLAELTP